MNNPRKINPRKAPKQERAKLKVAQILSAAKQLLVSEGLEKLTTNHIAKAANMSVGSLYQYFPNKQSIIYELYVEWLNINLSRLAPFRQRASETPIEQLFEEIFEAMYITDTDELESDFEIELTKAMKLYPELEELDHKHGTAMTDTLADILLTAGLNCSPETASQLGKFLYSLDTGVLEFQLQGGTTENARRWCRQAAGAVLATYLPAK